MIPLKENDFVGGLGGTDVLAGRLSVCLCLHARLYCLSGLCRPYGAKTTGDSLYPPLTQWATVVTPRRGVFVLPHKHYSESMTIVPTGRCNGTRSVGTSWCRDTAPVSPRVNTNKLLKT
ncbi:MAG: hypothetical protein HZB37_01890 [Planctomycetes bacterium]|nr:hypothetical protein [Planctomycetota bacterium]